MGHRKSDGRPSQGGAGSPTGAGFRALVDAVSADFEGGHQLCFIGQPFCPALPNYFFVYIGFGELDKQMIVAGFAFHKAAVELTQIGIVEPFAETFEALAATGFYESEDEELVQETGFFAAAFFLEIHEFIDIHVLSLGAQLQPSFLQFCEYETEMAPFFGDDGAQVLYKLFFGWVAADQRDTAGRGFLLAPGMVGEDIFQGDSGKVDPARVGG